MADSSGSTDVPCAAGCRLSFSWGMGTELQLVGLAPANAPIEEDSQRPFLTHISWTSNAAHRAVATAVAPAWADLQLQLQQSRDAGANGPSPGAQGTSLAAFSLLIRQQLLKQAASSSTKAEQIGMEAAVWGLLETLNLHCTQSEGFFAEEMAAWLEEQLPALNALLGVQPILPQRVAELLNADEGPIEAQPDYWPCIMHLVCLGQVADALQLIEAHSAVQQVATGAATDAATLQQNELMSALLHVILRQMPRFKRSYTLADPAMQARSGGLGRQFDNMADFESYRNNWLATVVQTPDSYSQLFTGQGAVAETAAGVRGVLSLLSGHEPTVLKHCSNWLEAAVALLLHQHPQLQLRQHAASLVGAVLRARPIAAEHENVLGLLRDLMLACAEGDVQEAINALASSYLITLWTMSHAYDLLSYSGPRMAPVLFRPIPQDGANQIEFFRLYLVESLMPSAKAAAATASWQLPLRYLAHCPQHGRPAAEAMISRLPVGSRMGSMRLLRKATAAARELGLASTAAQLARAAAAGAWYSGEIGVAMQLLGPAGGAGDAVRAAIALSPLEEYLSTELAALEPNYQRPALPQLANLEVQSVQHVLDRGTTSSSWLPAYIAAVRALRNLEQCQAAVTTPAAADAPASQTGAQQQQQQLQLAAPEFVSSLVRLVSGLIRKESDQSTTGTATTGSAAPLSTSLLLPALARLIPALELPACAAVCDDHALQKLLAAASQAAAGLSASVVSSPAIAARCVQDVQLCLARLACRAHVYGSTH